MLPSEGLKPIELSTHFPPAVPILINWNVGCHRQNAEQMRTSAFPANPVQGPMTQPENYLPLTVDKESVYSFVERQGEKCRNQPICSRVLSTC
jgi:hypothetical protein